ncbi:MAG: Mitochondrial outer membrane protein iml2 [Chrysothrix sp. TS-e1954]|nr:MAG: Mitochondrial outer membrane protein iml2 [Chrysothrix sp. TS-e1954]
MEDDANLDRMSANWSSGSRHRISSMSEDFSASQPEPQRSSASNSSQPHIERSTSRNSSTSQERAEHSEMDGRQALRSDFDHHRTDASRQLPAERPRQRSDAITNTEARHERQDSDTQASRLLSGGNTMASEPAVQVVPRVTSKIDSIAITTLVVGCIVIVACLGCLIFLWSADSTNPSWHWIVSKNHLQTLITGLAEALKQAITFQVGTVTAMTAAIMLESAQTSLGSAARLSLARSTESSTEALTLFRDQARGKLRKLRWNSLALYTIPLVAIVLAASQVFSILLVSDLDLATVAGNKGIDRVPYDFDYSHWGNWSALGNLPKLPVPPIENYGSGWAQQTADFPTFAEYSEPPTDEPGIDDTGLTLRAMLPFGSQATRQNLHNYEGAAMVVDTRVTCQAPAFDGLPVTIIPDGLDILQLNASILSRQPTPRLFNQTLQFGNLANFELLYNQSIDIGCNVSIGDVSDLWQVSLCQLPEDGLPFAGGLVSEFQPYPPFDEMKVKQDPKDQFWRKSSLWGIGHLVLNVTLGDVADWQQVLGSYGEQHPPQYQLRDNWLDLIYSGGKQVLSLSLCYSSFLTADMPVMIQSSTNRTEPIAGYDLGQSKYTFDSVRRMYGQDRTVSNSERGVMDLVKADSWLMNNTYSMLSPYAQFIRAVTDMSGPQTNAFDQPGYTGNYSATLTYSGSSEDDLATATGPLVPGVFIASLFQEIVQAGGSVAFAIQSILTSMATTSYYQQLPQFNLDANITHTPFITTNVPSSWTGLTVVIIVVFVHLCVMAVVISVFMTKTRFTTIGEEWQAIAQLVSPLTEPLLRGGTLMSDEEVKNQLAGKNRKKSAVRVDYMRDLERVGLVETPVLLSEKEVDEEASDD